MARFVRSVIVQDVTPAADGMYTYDLPVNPLSFIDFTLKCLNVAAEATLAQVLALVTKIEVIYRGAAIVSVSAADLYAMDCVLMRGVPVFTNLVATDDATRFVCLRIPLGRRPHDINESFPATKKGELQLQATVDIAATAADGLILQVETVELLDVTPTQYLKYTTLSAAASAAGDLDIGLPLGNDVLGLLLFSTTKPTSTSWLTTINKLKILLDNVEYGYANANWESMHGDLLARGGMPLGDTDAWTDDAIAHYSYADYDPNDDGTHAVPTRGRSTFTARIDAGDTSAIRIIPVELIKVGA